MLADRGVVTGRKAHDEFVSVRGLGGGDDLSLRGAELAERDVVADGAAEQMHDLADIGNLPPQRGAGNRRNVLTVDEDTAGAGFVKAQQQVQHG